MIAKSTYGFVARFLFLLGTIRVLKYFCGCRCARRRLAIQRVPASVFAIFMSISSAAPRFYVFSACSSIHSLSVGFSQGWK